MVDLPGWLRMNDFPCLTCRERLLMPDGSLYCSLTMRPKRRGSITTCNDYGFGSGTVYKLVPTKVPKRVTEVKPKEVKPKVIKQIPSRSSKKISPQKRLF